MPGCVLLLNYLALAELLPESNSYSVPRHFLCHFGGISTGMLPLLLPAGTCSLTG